MMKTIRSRKMWMLSACTLLLPVLFTIYYFHPGEMGSLDGRQLELQTFQLRDGWGYRIVMNRKTLIYQPTIPAIDTLMSFPDQASANAIGSLVLERLNANRDFSITKEDIKTHSLKH